VRASARGKSAPVLAALKPRLKALWPGCSPHSPLGKAIHYALAEWEPLNRFLRVGRLEIDTNLTENTIRPSAAGMKNWLFIGHPAVGWRSAVIYSVIVSCRRRGPDPWLYVRDILQRLPGMKQSELPILLPRGWKPLDTSAS
jgi:transposase